MPTEKRLGLPRLIQELLAEPWRFDLFQAAGLLEQWLAEAGGAIRYRNSVRLAFAPSDIESIECGEDAAFRITPACVGLLGTHGALPHHYTDMAAVAAPLRDLLDMLTSRFISLYVAAWRVHRLEWRDARGRDRMARVLLALAGHPRGAPPAFHMGALRQRAVTAAHVHAVLTHHLRAPAQVRGLVPSWSAVPPGLTARLGRSGCSLDGTAILGDRLRRRDQRVHITLGPMRRDEYDTFVPGTDGARELAALLALFHVPMLTYEVRLVLHKDDVPTSALGDSTRLGRTTFLAGAPSRDRDDLVATVASK